MPYNNNNNITVHKITKSQLIRNPVLASPWDTLAPRGICYGSNREKYTSYFSTRPLFDIQCNRKKNIQQASYQHLKIFQDLKILNRNTLILSFPKLHHYHIEAALALCGYDLSETLKLLLLRERILKNKLQLQEGVLKYMPTRDPDVEILEVCNPTHGLSDDDVKKMHYQNTSMIPKTVEDVGSPSTASNESSNDSYKLGDYDFANAGRVTYNLPKPSGRSIQKVGIVLRKSEHGLSVKLL